MEDLIQNIYNIISESNNQINDKSLGTNYLEKLKYLLIDKLKTFKIVNMKNVANFKNKEIILKYNQNNLLIKLENNSHSLSKIRNIIQNDYLCIVLKGSKFIKIYNNSDSIESHSINLFPSTGVVLSSNTVISESLSKDSVLIDIFNTKNDKDIVNSESNII